jgi:hypothetical protein
MRTLFLEIIILLILPISAMTVHEDIYALRHLYALTVTIYFLIFKHHIQLPSFQTMFSIPPRKVILKVIGISLFTTTLLFLLHHQNHKLIDDMVMALVIHPHLKFLGLIAYPLISVPIQEILFRWFFLYYTKSQINQLSIVIILNAAVFSLAHLPFLSPLMLLGTFCLGLWWSHLTLKHHSLIPSLISHAIIGTTLLYLGL